MEKDHSKDNITTKYIEYKDKNTGTSCNSIRIWKTVSLKPSFGLSV